MRVLLIIFLCFLTTTNQEDVFDSMSFSRFGVKYDKALEAIFSVAVRLEALLSNTGVKSSKNFMVSPLNMAAAIGELMLGARGALQKELFDLLVIDTEAKDEKQTVRHIPNNLTKHIAHYALHEQLGDLIQNLQFRGNLQKKYELTTASTLFTQFNMPINEEYRYLVKRFYNTNVQLVNFLDDPQGTEEIINHWVQRTTHGLIKNLIPGGFSTSTVAILANAIYFRGDWEIPFSSEINRILPFRMNARESVNVTFMMGEFENYKYLDSKRFNCKMVGIPYKNNELSMYIILPNENYDINQFVATLSIKDFLELTNSLVQRKVFMIMPKMTLTNTIKILEPLRRYHSYKNQLEVQQKLNSLLGDKLDVLNYRVNFFKNISSLPSNHSLLSLDLSGISPNPAFHLGEIYQQMTLSVNEKGTEAAAVAASAIDYILDSVTMRVDRPFLFFIRDELTEATLFWGTIVDPTETTVT